MNANQATNPVRVMGRLLGVSASGFYAWMNRPPSARALADIALTAKIHAIHRRSGGAYGAPSIHAELADDYQTRVGKKRVARLMRTAGLAGLQLRRFVTTTVSDPTADRAVDQKRFVTATATRGCRRFSFVAFQNCQWKPISCRCSAKSGSTATTSRVSATNSTASCHMLRPSR